jgi:hypothetical protein
MAKQFIAAVIAASLYVPQAAGQSILQKTDWKETKFETFLPSTQAVPWLNLDTRTKLPKGDLPIGREANTAGPLVLQPAAPDTRVSSNTLGGLRRM